MLRTHRRSSGAAWASYAMRHHGCWSVPLGSWPTFDSLVAHSDDAPTRCSSRSLATFTGAHRGCRVEGSSTTFYCGGAPEEGPRSPVKIANTPVDQTSQPCSSPTSSIRPGQCMSHPMTMSGDKRSTSSTTSLASRSIPSRRAGRRNKPVMAASSSWHAPAAPWRSPPRSVTTHRGSAYKCGPAACSSEIKRARERRHGRPHVRHHGTRRSHHQTCGEVVVSRTRCPPSSGSSDKLHKHGEHKN